MLLNKYMAFSVLEFKRLLLYKEDIIMDIFLIVMRVFLPYFVFASLARQGSISWDLANNLILAVLIGQILNRASGKLDKEIKQEIRSGDIINQLNLPANYLLMKFFGSGAVFFYKLVFYLLIFVPILTLLFALQYNFFLLLGLSFLAWLISFLLSFCLGLSSFILEENEGLFYIMQKLYMLLGNQVIPVFLMPAWVLGFAKFTPFFLALAAPIEVASGRLELLPILLSYLSNIIVFSLILYFLYNGLRKKVILNGF